MERIGQDLKGTSLAVRQFMAILRGAVMPHAPNNPFRVDMVREEQHYCLTCYGKRWFDVVIGVDLDGEQVMMKRCRCCGAEVCDEG